MRQEEASRARWAAEILRNRVAFARTFMNTFHEEDQRIMGHAADGGMKAPITVSG
jgi:hypothetical protein